MGNNDTKINTYDKEKVTKKFRIFEKFVLGLEILMIIGAILIGITVIGVGATIVEDADNNVQEISGEQYIIESDISDEELIAEENTEDDLNILSIIFLVVQVIISFFILDILRRLFKETADKETPFTETNVKRMSILSDLVFIWWLLSTSDITLQTILFVIVIAGIEHMFKYGYELQKEADELL